MILLFLVAALVFLAVRLVRLCAAALVAVTKATVLVSTVPDTASTGPQDAPLGEPWHPMRGLQDAPGYPQDAPAKPAECLKPVEPVEPIEPLEPVVGQRPASAGVSGEGSGPSRRRVVTQVAAAVAGTRHQGAALSLTELPDGRLVLSLTLGRDSGSVELLSERREEAPATAGGSMLDLVPRPTTGPAYLGGRDDDAYLRGWDDGIDWARQGHPERSPSWSSAAYMTGWNDSVKAVAKVRRG